MKLYLLAISIFIPGIVRLQVLSYLLRTDNWGGEFIDDVPFNSAPKTGGSGFKPPSPGVTVRKSGNYWVKEVDPNANALARWYGKRSLKYQSEGLTKLGDMAPAHIFKNGKLITRDAGQYTPGNFWKTWYQGSKRLGTPMNDIRPRNIGANGMIFDPALDPIARGLYWTAGAGLVGAGGYGLYELFDDE